MRLSSVVVVMRWIFLHLMARVVLSLIVTVMLLRNKEPLLLLGRHAVLMLVVVQGRLL
jgi:hypothetical protein